MTQNPHAMTTPSPNKTTTTRKIVDIILKSRTGYSVKGVCYQILEYSDNRGFMPKSFDFGEQENAVPHPFMSFSQRGILRFADVNSNGPIVSQEPPRRKSGGSPRALRSFVGWVKRTRETHLANLTNSAESEMSKPE
jgi:hypothetical protein